MTHRTATVTLGLVVVALASSSCASTSGPAGAREPALAVPSGYWDNPFGNASVEIADVAEANLPFEADVPGEDLGQPVRIVTSDPSEPSVAREIAWVYDDPTYGRFIVRERAVNLSGAQKSISDLLGASPGCLSTGENGATVECHYGDRSAVHISDDVIGVLVAGAATTFVRWAGPATVIDEDAFADYANDFPVVGLLVEVIGPSGEFTPEEALAVAALV
jgi:hypothetical protein